MDYNTLQNFYSDWAFESDIMAKYFDQLTDESLMQKVSPDGRNLGFIAWHCVTTINEMMSQTGIKVNCPEVDSEPPSSANEILSAFNVASEYLIEQLKLNWTDDSLQQEDNMYGENWKRGKTLNVLIAHQTHHRGQMSVLMRQAGLKVPGSYGPSKEEWIEMGMNPMR